MCCAQTRCNKVIPEKGDAVASAATVIPTSLTVAHAPHHALYDKFSKKKKKNYSLFLKSYLILALNLSAVTIPNRINLFSFVERNVFNIVSGVVVLNTISIQ